MKVPLVRGTIARRILVNYRIAPDVLALQLPAPFRPKLGPGGYAVAGICLIRLREIRPRFVPAAWGIHSENAAHRMAVEWDTPHGVQEGVYIPRRDSSSRLNALVGGRLFPGTHHLADFEVRERDGEYRVALQSRDGLTQMLVEGRVAETLPADSMFSSLPDASTFFERGALGYSATQRPDQFDGLELRTFQWHVEPLQVTAVASSYFEDANRFPSGSTTFDCALLMRDLAHEWHARAPLHADCVAPAA